MPDDFNIHVGFAVWSALLTALGGFIVWNWNRLVKQQDDLGDKLDTKVDRAELVQLRQDIQNAQDARERARLEDNKAQERMHRENRQRLDQILSGIAGLRSDRNLPSNTGD